MEETTPFILAVNIQHLPPTSNFSTALPNHVYNFFTQRFFTQEFVCESCMRCHHFYKDVWVPDPMRSEVLTCVREAGNADHYSVAMINSSMTVVGHESVINGRSRDT